MRRWLQQLQTGRGNKRPGLTTDELEKLKKLLRENLELKRSNEILRKTSAKTFDSIFDSQIAVSVREIA